MTAKISLDEARVLIVGGSGALGGAIAEEMATRGARLVLAGRDETRLRSRASKVGADATIVFDLRKPRDGARVVDEAVTALGGLDGLVNAAGVVAFGPIEDLDDRTLEELVIVDFMAPLRVIRSAVARMEGGFVVNLTGVVAESPVAGMTAYSAVKSALSTASLALGRELRRHGIHVLDARPPHSDTGLARRAIAGSPPGMPAGLPPEKVARVIVDGLIDRRRELGADAFAG